MELCLWYVMRRRGHLPQRSVMNGLLCSVVELSRASCSFSLNMCVTNDLLQSWGVKLLRLSSRQRKEYWVTVGVRVMMMVMQKNWQKTQKLIYSKNGMLHQTLFMAGTFCGAKSLSTESFKDITAWIRRRMPLWCYATIDIKFLIILIKWEESSVL